MSLLLLFRTTSSAPVIAGTATATATSSLALTAGPSLSLTTTAAATGSLSLDSGAVGGLVAAPGWLGIFDRTTAVNTALIAGTSTAATTGSLTLLVPSSALISSAVASHATSTLTLVITQRQIVRNTILASRMYGSTTTTSAQRGSFVVVGHDEAPIPA